MSASSSMTSAEIDPSRIRCNCTGQQPIRLYEDTHFGWKTSCSIPGMESDLRRTYQASWRSRGVGKPPGRRRPAQRRRRGQAEVEPPARALTRAGHGRCIKRLRERAQDDARASCAGRVVGSPGMLRPTAPGGRRISSLLLGPPSVLPLLRVRSPSSDSHRSTRRTTFTRRCCADPAYSAQRLSQPGPHLVAVRLRGDRSRHPARNRPSSLWDANRDPFRVR